MKKHKNKVTKDIQDILIAKSKEMPVMYKTDGFGQPLYKRGEIDGSQVGKDKHGNNGVPGVKYIGNVLQYENHFENMLHAFQNEGMGAVTYYCEKMEQIHKNRLRYVEQNQPAKKPWRARAWLKVKSLFAK